MKLINKLFSRKSSRSCYYPITKTCQIRDLSVIYEQYFGKIDNGRFVEIGAYDGEYVSNTSGLADIGWSGIYVEPVPAYFNKCQYRHRGNSNIQVINAAVGDRESSITMHIGGPLSTASEGMRDHFKTLAWAKEVFCEGKKCDVEMVTLDALLRRCNFEPCFELLVVDVEGFEWDVLKNFDIGYWSPKMIIIELHDQNDDYFNIREKCIRLVNYFHEGGYKPIWKDFTNTIFVPNGSFPLPLSQR